MAEVYQIWLVNGAIKRKWNSLCSWYLRALHFHAWHGWRTKKRNLQEKRGKITPSSCELLIRVFISPSRSNNKPWFVIGPWCIGKGVFDVWFQFSPEHKQSKSQSKQYQFPLASLLAMLSWYPKVYILSTSHAHWCQRILIRKRNIVLWFEFEKWNYKTSLNVSVE